MNDCIVLNEKNIHRLTTQLLIIVGKIGLTKLPLFMACRIFDSSKQEVYMRVQSGSFINCYFDGLGIDLSDP